MARVNRFEASYDSDCENCGEMIYEGDEAGYVYDEVCCQTCCNDAEDDF